MTGSTVRCSLNPFFIRSQLVLKMIYIFDTMLCLNPFFIRSQLVLSPMSTIRAGVCLNPFFIRSQLVLNWVRCYLISSSLNPFFIRSQLVPYPPASHFTEQWVAGRVDGNGCCEKATEYMQQIFSTRSRYAGATRWSSQAAGTRYGTGQARFFVGSSDDQIDTAIQQHDAIGKQLPTQQAGV